MAAGLHWFLKYACRSSVSWNATGGNSIDGSCFTPSFLAGLEQQGGMRRERSVPWHYYQNVVTPRSDTPRMPWPALSSRPYFLPLRIKQTRRRIFLLHTSGHSLDQCCDRKATS